MNISAYNAGLNGIHRAQNGMQQAATNIANSSFEDAPVGDLAAEFVSLKANGQLFDASARVIDIASQTTGSLLDILA